MEDPKAVSRAPDHEFDPEGLTTPRLINRMLQAPDTCKVIVETSDDDERGEGTPIGRVVEVQWGRDGNVYLRIDATQDAVRDTLKEV